MIISKKEKKIWIIIGIGLIAFAIFQSVKKYSFDKELHRCNKILSQSYIYETNYIYVKTSGLWVYYRYGVKGKSFSNRSNLGLGYSNELKSELLNKIVPLIYCKESPNISSVLITPEQFKEYGYSFPDSLAWIKDYKKH